MSLIEPMRISPVSQGDHFTKDVIQVTF